MTSLPLAAFRRGSLPLASLLAVAACADDPATPVPADPRPAVTAIPLDPDPRALPDDAPPPAAPRCIPDDATSAQYGTSVIDEFRDVAVARDGTILVAGSDQGQPSFYGTRYSRGVVLAYRDAFTALGTIDTTGTDSFESIAIDPDTQRVWLAGRTNDAIVGFPTAGNHDVVLGELVAAGFQPMVRGYDSTPEIPTSLAIHDGRLAVAGQEARTTAEGELWINPFLATYETAATMAPQWLTTRRHADSEVYATVDVASDAIVVGGNISEGEQPGMFVAGWSHDADVLWRHQLSTLAFDQITAVRMLPDGTLVWAGTTSATLGEAAHGGTDIVVGTLNPATGERLWTAQLGSEADESVVDIAIDRAGNIHVAGGVTTADPYDRDVLLLTLDPSGNVVKSEQWGSPELDVATAVAVDACGTAVVVGVTSGELAGPLAGMRDGFLLISR